MKQFYALVVGSLVLTLLTSNEVSAASRTWSGPAGGNWFTAGNWTPSDNYPQSDDAVTITNGTVFLTNATAPLVSFSITNATLTFTNWTTALNATDVTIWNNGKLQTTACNTNALLSNTNRVLIYCSNLTINAGGSINVTEQGYIGGRNGQVPARGTGPGGGASSGARGGAGSYGGKGGNADDGTLSGGTYGSESAPGDPGSGGGGGGSFGKNGGGAVWIQADGAVLVDGQILADGGQGNDQSASGSGGGINITCRTINGAGVIRASGLGNNNSGGGGGGRIAVNYNTTAQLDITPKPRIAFSVAGGPDSRTGGQRGTLYFPDTTVFGPVVSYTGALIIPGVSSCSLNSLMISNSVVQFPTNCPLIITNDLVLMQSSVIISGNTSMAVGGNLLLTNSSSLSIYSPATNNEAYSFLAAVTGNVTVASGCNLYPYSTPSNGGVVKFSASNFYVNGAVDATAKGYTGVPQGPGKGPGGGKSGGAGSYGGGGSYGGRGGDGQYAAGATYGSASQPTEPGSAGGGGSGAAPGNGGGAVWLNAADAVIVNGSVLANGGNGNGDQSAASSGGGIYITCQTFQGVGSVQANGGNLGGNGGGGGGGRIAVIYNPAAQSLVSPVPSVLFSVAGGTAGSVLRYGQKGTLYFPDTALLKPVLPHTGTLGFQSATAWGPDSLTISNGTVEFPPSFLLSVTNDLVVRSGGGLILANCTTLPVGNNLILTNGGALTVQSPPTNGTTGYGCLIAVTNNLLVYAGSTLFLYSDPTNGGSIKLAVSNASIAVTGSINADSGGWVRSNTTARGYGPGGGIRGANSGGGGGYGGIGGRGAHPDSYGGTNYGSASLPLLAGSAGGDYRGSNIRSGSGGGLIWLEAVNQVTVGGTLSANGDSPSGYQGAGAGGGIYINAKILGPSTSGVIRANGGTGGSESGGGGGGRIAVVNWLTNQYDGTLSVAGGTNTHALATSGKTGTIYSVQTLLPCTLYVRGAPARHEVSVPYDYGAYALNTGTAVLNDIAQVAEQVSENSRYYLLGWSVTNSAGTVVAEDITTNAGFTLNENLTQIWIWTNQWYLRVASASGGGVPANPTGWYTNANVISVSATSDVNWVFSGWINDGIEYSVPFANRLDNPITLTLNQARWIKATFVDTTPQTRYWSGTNTWLGGTTNWVPNGVPGPNDTLVVTNGLLVIPTPSQAASLTVSNATVLFTNWLSLLTVSDLTVQSNGIITHAVCNTNGLPGNTNRVFISTSNLTVDVGGLIDVNAKGYVGGTNSSGQGPGGGVGTGNSGGGGGHGGFGGSGNPGHNSYGGASYGSSYIPQTVGSGGGGAQTVNAGGAGGGAVYITASGVATVNGTVRANGQAGQAGNAGGGSGGSVYLACSALAGTGLITANGAVHSGEGGFGGGGRVAVAYSSVAQAAVSPQPTIRFSAAAGVNNYAVVSQGGTIYLPDSQFFPETLSTMLLNTGRVFGVTSWAPNTLTVQGAALTFEEPGFQLYVTNALRVTGAGSWLALTNAAVTVGGSVTVSNGAALNLWRGVNSTESLSVGGQVVLDRGTLRFQYPLTNPTALSITGDITLTNTATLHLYSGMTNAPTPGYGGLLAFSGKNLVIPTNCGVYVYCHPTNGGAMKLAVASLTVAAGGRLSGDGGGFMAPTNKNARGYGPGAGYGNISGGGGGYGGAGGQGNYTHGANWGGPAYGLATNPPVYAGSAGGHGNIGAGEGGGAGGALVWVDAVNRIAVDGTVTANGANGVGPGGGGSGGGIYLYTRRFEGSASGTLSVRGGDYGGESGGGGGGRIQVWSVFGLETGPLMSIVTNGGTFGHPSATNGLPGTAYFGQIRVPMGSIFMVR